MEDTKTTPASETQPEPKTDHHKDEAAHQPAPLSEWPGAFGAFKPSRTAVRRNLSTIVLLWVLALAAGVLVGMIFGKVWWLNELVAGLVGAVFTGAQILAYIASVRGRHIEIGDSINQALPVFWKLFLLNLLTAFSIALGLILFIIPGLIILPRLVLAPYFLMDQKLGILEAYQASWNQTKGHSGKVWGLFGVAILMLLPTLTVVGVVFTVYWLVMYSAVTAMLYQYIIDHQPAAQG